MAENFIANDIVCQNITNTYVQTNLKKARDALQRTYVTSEITYRHGEGKIDAHTIFSCYFGLFYYMFIHSLNRLIEDLHRNSS